MPDNLTVSISADTTKFSADLAVAQAKLAEFTKQLREAAKAATATGDRSGLLVAAKNAEIARATVVGLSKALVASRAASDAAIGDKTHGMMGLVAQTKELAGSFVKIDEGIGLLRGALAGTGLLAVADQVGAVNRELQGLQNTAKATNLSTGFIQAFKDQLKGTGQDAEAATPILVKFTEQLAKARLEGLGAGETGGGPTVFRGMTDAVRTANNEVTTLRGNLNDSGTSLVNVLHGTKQVAADLSSPFKTAQFDVKQYAASIEGNEKALEDFAKRLIDLKNAGRIDEADQAAFAAFGRHFAEVAPVLEQFASRANVQQLQTGLQAKGVLASSDDLARQKQYNDALNEMSTSLEGLRKEAVVSAFPWLSGQVKQATADIEEMAASIKEVWGSLLPFFTQLWASVSEQAKQMWAGIVAQATEAYQAVIAVWTAIPQFFEHLGQSVIDTVDATSKAIRNAASAAGGASTASPFAAGGTVPGSGTGDSVAAMLTPGEYVNRLSSVQYYGAELFHALNSRLIPRDVFRGWGYSLGGLVDSLHAPPRHYADGGMVESAGGRLAVDINMGGHTFPMSSDREVASRLVRFARSESMRSAGIKPSWVS
jgi:hypothetical protein